ncbi:hypothetical protein L915_15267, partial [Phytophthora nicotianae]
VLLKHIQFVAFWRPGSLISFFESGQSARGMNCLTRARNAPIGCFRCSLVTCQKTFGGWAGTREGIWTGDVVPLRRLDSHLPARWTEALVSVDSKQAANKLGEAIFGAVVLQTLQCRGGFALRSS